MPRAYIVVAVNPSVVVTREDRVDNIDCGLPSRTQAVHHASHDLVHRSRSRALDAFIVQAPNKGKVVMLRRSGDTARASRVRVRDVCCGWGPR